MNKYTLDGVLALMKLRENSGNEVIAVLGLDIRPAEEEPNGFVGIPQLRKVFGEPEPSVSQNACHICNSCCAHGLLLCSWW